MPVLVAAVAAGALLFGAPSVSAREAVPDPHPPGGIEPTPSFEEYWVAAHVPTTLWTDADEWALPIGSARQWELFMVVGPQHAGRLYVWDPRSEDYAWIDADDVGAVDPSLAGTGYLPPIGARILWAGSARITMYTCVELGGCAPTASGIWPQPGVVAVDPRVIPLGSKVWIEGLGTFLAADTGSLVIGDHLDVFSTSYHDAVQWGVQRLPIVVFE